jgi:hypothetical protein
MYPSWSVSFPKQAKKIADLLIDELIPPDGTATRDGLYLRPGSGAPACQRRPLQKGYIIPAIE